MSEYLRLGLFFNCLQKEQMHFVFFPVVLRTYRVSYVVRRANEAGADFSLSGKKSRKDLCFFSVR